MRKQRKPKCPALHIAYVPGAWSSRADEWFVYERIVPGGPLVSVRWRHGPGISNTRRAPKRKGAK